MDRSSIHTLWILYDDKGLMKKYIQNAKSWKDLNNTLSQFTKSNQPKLAGDIFEYLTKLYLETAPQYKSKLKKVYLLNKED